jgi:hypothetical protein
MGGGTDHGGRGEPSANGWMKNGLRSGRGVLTLQTHVVAEAMMFIWLTLMFIGGCVCSFVM